MSIEIKMPALSPTMEEGTLAKWLVKEGDQVKSGDIMAEIETDKATMEFEAVDEGTIARILVAEGTDGVKVGTAIAILAEDGEDAGSVEAPTKSETPEPTDPEFKGRPDPTDPNAKGDEGDAAPRTEASAEDHGRPDDAGAEPASGDRVKASPLARRIAAEKGVDLSGVSGSGPNGRIVKADVEGATPEPGAGPTGDEAPSRVRPAGPVPLSAVVSVHCDEEDAEAAVAVAAEVLDAAAAGDEDAVMAVGEAEDGDLLWFDAQELPDLVARLRG